MFPTEIEPVVYVYHSGGGCRYKISIVDNAGVDIEYEESSHGESSVTWEKIKDAELFLAAPDLQNMITALSMFAEWLGESDD